MPKIIKAENTKSVVVQRPPIPYEIKDVGFQLVTLFERTSTADLVSCYQNILADTVLKLTIIPTERTFLGRESTDDEDSVSEAFESIIDQLAVAFNKSTLQVDKDIKRIMNDFPIDDVRESHMLARKGLLH